MFKIVVKNGRIVSVTLAELNSIRKAGKFVAFALGV